MKHYICAFYKFTPIAEPEKIKEKLTEFADKKKIKGLVILGTEGINSTSSAQTHEDLQAFKSFVTTELGFGDITFKDSVSEIAPFKRFSIKIRDEIVTLGAPDLHPDKEINHHLSPEEWDNVIKSDPNAVVIDTRNWYETKIGTFKNALTPGIDKFTEFCDWVDDQKFPKDKKMLIFCTGGIRCEKGIYEMQRRGYSEVYQLEGGILNYLQQKPNQEFEGECFVFDHRVAVDQNLQPSKIYKLCPHCGQPGTIKIVCQRCDSEGVICEVCHEKNFRKETCSKHCAHQWELRPGKKGKKQVQNISV